MKKIKQENGIKSSLGVGVGMVGGAWFCDAKVVQEGLWK